jgi:UDP-glucose 4-epimerase
VGNRVILAGGAGYIGCHVLLELLERGRRVFVVDDFSNSSLEALRRVEKLVGTKVEWARIDLANPLEMDRLLSAVSRFEPDCAILLAGLKAVGESVVDPSRYYKVNLGAAQTLVEVLNAVGARSLVFSSSAAIYGDRNDSPVNESAFFAPVSPYGRTKLFIEEMLRDLARADRRWRICNLRYFNPVGAHASGLIGEDPRGSPGNLFTLIAQVAGLRRQTFNVFGNDYPTRDGTGVRDYVHVVDIAKGHVEALEYLAGLNHGCSIDVNLGTGVGYTVLEAVAAFCRVSNRDIPYIVASRRPGDVAKLYADTTRAKHLLGWQATHDLEEMCADHWRWQVQNPNGYTNRI